MSEPAEQPDATGADTPAETPRFRLLLVPGIVPASWVRTWRERVADVHLELVHTTVDDAERALAEGRADAALLRLPVDRDILSAIPLYVEATVVIVPKDHLLTALDEVGPDDLADETLLVPGDDVLRWADPPGEPSALPTPPTTGDAVELVASGVGLLVVPQSLARLYHRRDLTYQPLTDAPESQVALAWLGERDGDPLVEELIGIVRGRTVNSSRGRGAPRDDAEPAAKGQSGRGDAAGRRSGGADGRGGGPRRGGGPQRTGGRTQGRSSGGRGSSGRGSSGSGGGSGRRRGL